MYSKENVLHINYLDMAPMSNMGEVFLEGVWTDEDLKPVLVKTDLFLSTIQENYFYHFKEVQVVATNRLDSDRMIRFYFTGYEDVTRFFKRKEKIAGLL